jgi:hypothetical protein
MLGYNNLPRASLVGVTYLHVPSRLFPSRRPHPAYRRGTGVGIAVCNPSQAQAYGFCEANLSGGTVVQWSRQRPRRTAMRTCTSDIGAKDGHLAYVGATQHMRVKDAETCQSRAQPLEHCSGSARAPLCQRRATPFLSGYSRNQGGTLHNCGGRRVYLVVCTSISNKHRVVKNFLKIVIV